jgi:hypothetical protein
MARRGQGDIKPRTALEAGKSRARASQAEKEKGAFYERGAQDIQRGAAAADQAIQYQTEKIKAKKIRGEETAFRDKQFKEKQLQAQTAEQQRQEQLNMQAASQGLQAKGERPATPREQALEQEMGKGTAQPTDPGLERLRQQGEKPLEVPGERGGTVPGQGGAAEFEFTEEAKEAQAAARGEKALMNQLRRQKLGQDIEKARIKGDEEGVKLAQKSLDVTINSNVSRLNRVMNGKGTPNDWADIRKLAEGTGDTEVLAAIEQASKTGMVGGRIRDFLTNQIIVGDGGVLDRIAIDGDLPAKGVDSSNPAMQQFYQNINVVQRALQEAHAANPQDVTFQGIRTFEDLIRFRQSEAARLAKAQLGGQDKQAAVNQAMASQQADPQQQAYLDQQRREGITQEQEQEGVGTHPWKGTTEEDWSQTVFGKPAAQGDQQRTAKAMKRAGPMR